MAARSATSRSRVSQNPGVVDAVMALFSSIMQLLMSIFDSVRRLTGNLPDNEDSFLSKPSPDFVSAAPADPNYQTLAFLNDDDVFKTKKRK